MQKESYRKKIIKEMKSAGTYKTQFDMVINTLSSILERRDEAEEEYIESGGKPIVEHTNNGGTTNRVKNPALTVWDDLNKTALTYWRDLGLTPAGLKKLKDDALKVSGASFGDLIKSING